MLTIGVGRQPTPKNVFYRTHKTFRPVVPLVNVEVGMDRHFIAARPLYSLVARGPRPSCQSTPTFGFCRPCGFASSELSIHANFWLLQAMRLCLQFGDDHGR
jgi:hypothetical protein